MTLGSIDVDALQALRATIEQLGFEVHAVELESREDGVRIMPDVHADPAAVDADQAGRPAPHELAREVAHEIDVGDGDGTTRVSIRMPRPLFAAIEERVDAGAYHSRSAAIRDACQEMFVDDEDERLRPDAASTREDLAPDDADSNGEASRSAPSTSDDDENSADETPPDDAAEEPAADPDDQDGDDGDDSDDEQEDEEEDLDARVVAWVNDHLVEQDELTVEAATIADDLDVDGRKVPWALKRIADVDGYGVEKQEREFEAALWTVTPEGDRATEEPAGVDEPDGDDDVDEPADEDVDEDDEDVREDGDGDPDDEAAEIVYIGRSRAATTYHRERNCSRLEPKGEPVEKELSVVPNSDPCSYCCPEAEAYDEFQPQADPDDAATVAPDESADRDQLDVQDKVEQMEAIAEWIVDRIPDVDGGTFVVDPSAVAAEFRLSAQSAITNEAMRAAKGIEIVEHRPHGQTSWLVKRDRSVPAAEAAAIGGRSYSDADFDISKAAVREAARDAETLPELADEPGCGSAKALRLIGVYDLGDLLAGVSEEVVADD